MRAGFMFEDRLPERQSCLSRVPPVDRQGNVQAGRRSILPERVSPRPPRRQSRSVCIFTLVAFVAMLGWGISPAAAGLQDAGSPEAGSPVALPPEMFRNDPDRNGQASGPGPIDTDRIEELWSFEAGGDVESSP